MSGRRGFEVTENLRFKAAGDYEDVFAELDPTATRDGFAEKHDRVWSGRVGAELGLFDGLWTQHLDLYGSRTRRRFDEEAMVSRFRSEEHTSELQSLMRISYAVFCLKKKTHTKQRNYNDTTN